MAGRAALAVNPDDEDDLLVGRIEHKLDKKKRLIIPLQWYERMGRPKEVCVMQSLTNETCLDVLTLADFMARLRPFRNRPLSDKKAAAFLREISETTERLQVDLQNRIRIPDEMLDFIGLGDSVETVLLGSSRQFEVWSKARRPKPRMDVVSHSPGFMETAEEREF